MQTDFLYPSIVPDIVDEDQYDDIGALLTDAVVYEYVSSEQRKLKDDRIWQYGRQNFQNDDGKPWEMSPGELAIFKAILFRQHHRMQVCSSTQYGKTITIARALLSRITTYPDEFLLLVPDTKRGRIIIRYMISDTTNNPYFSSKLAGIKLGEANQLLLRLLEEKSKSKLTYQIIGDDDTPRYGSVEILTAEAHRKQDVITNIMGFGGRNIIADESALTSDDVEAGVHRMMAGKGEDTFYMKIGNPFFQNHFRVSWADPLYKKIFVNDSIGLAEGRYLPSFLEEARKKPQYSVLYGCKFPPAKAMDREGWIPLLTKDEIRLAMQEAMHFGEERIGGDVADDGLNESTIVKRSTGYAEVLFSQANIDGMAFTGHLVHAAREGQDRLLFIDRIGVGANVYSRLLEVNQSEPEKTKRMLVTGVKSGETADDPKQFFNRRAEMAWRAREWIKSGGKLSQDDRWYQLAKLKYTNASNGSIKLMSKKEMLKRGIPSPDVADALCMTFFSTNVQPRLTDEDRFFYRKMREENQKNKKRYSKGFTLGRPR